jgi:uncharacterized protein
VDLKRKLSRLAAPSVPAPADVEAAPAESPVVADLRRRIQALAASPRAKQVSARQRGPRHDTLPAVLCETPHGAVHRREHRFGVEHRHGSVALARSLEVLSADLGKLALDPALADVDPRRIVFFDTETTGLAGGTGTLAFLVGLGFYEDGGFKFEQLLLPEPGHEAPLLRYVVDRFAAADCVASFNGKSFDWPLLRTRCALGRINLPTVRHLDVLHCARRVFKFRGTEARLTYLEREVLGFEREDDLPGFEIPRTYFAYLRGGHGRGLEPVLTHNLHDLLALVALLGYVGERFAAAPPDDDPRERLGLAHAAARAGDSERAIAFAELVAAEGSGRLAAEALLLAGELHHKRGDVGRAATVYEDALVAAAGRPKTCAELRLRLAKLYEHALRDLARALEHAHGTALAEGQGAQQRRLARLSRRVARA